MNNHRMFELAQALAVAKSRQDVPAALQLLHADMLLESPAFGTMARGIAENEKVLTRFFTSFPDYNVVLQGHASNHDTLLKVGGTVLIAVALHNVLGMAAGYLTARAFGLGDGQVRAIAIEVAVQDSGLGVVLAKAFFGNAAALPSAVFSVWQNLSGPVAAWLFRRNMKS